MRPRRELARLFVRENKALTLLLVFTAAAAVARKSFGRIADQPLRDAAGRGPPPDSEDAADGSRTIWVPYKKSYIAVKIQSTPKEVLDRDAAEFLSGSDSFLALARILIPRLASRVVLMLIFHAGLLSLRTYLSFIVANLDGRIVRHLIAAEGYEFASGIIEWLALAVPAAYTNAMIRYLQGSISLEFRRNLVHYVHDLYLDERTEMYKLINIEGMDAVNHYIATDIPRFCDAVAQLYSSLGKPLLDLVFFAYQLKKNLGGAAMAGIFANYLATAACLKAIAPPFGRLAQRESRLEGEYRNRHARLIANAEEIAFYDGAAVERRSLRTAFCQLVTHISRVLRVKAAYSMVESYVLKYSWSGSGFLFVSIPVFMPTWTGHKPLLTERARMGEFITNKRLMLSMADAGGRILYSIKDVAELAGYSRRVFDLVVALHRVRSNAYKLSPGTQIEPYSLVDVKGKVENEDNDDIGLEFRDVPLVVPGGGDLSAGEVLIDPLSFSVRKGEHLFITGANGSGKTSIARIAAGLWPLYRGLLRRHPSLAFLSQRPYFPIGTLRDQITYPRTHADMLREGHTDDELLTLLAKVNLAYVPKREGGLDARAEWQDVLSGGEKQRLLFARLLYGRPRYAFIDEGTAAVSSDTEGLLYDLLKSEGITLITISHRASLLKYHAAKLELGEGDNGQGWSYEKCDSATSRGSAKRESERMREFLANVPAMEARREQICRQLLGHA